MQQLYQLDGGITLVPTVNVPTINPVATRTTTIMIQLKLFQLMQLIVKMKSE